MPTRAQQRRALQAADELDAGVPSAGADRTKDLQVMLAAACRGIERERARLFGGARPFLYLIQDDEPNFYGSSR